jgi:hypothetical protein
MSQNISQLFEAKKKHPIILKWRTTHNDASLVNSIPKVINEDHVVIDNKGINEDQILITKESEHLVDQRGSQTQKVMIFMGINLIRLYMTALLLWLQSIRDIIMSGTLNITITLFSHRFTIIITIAHKQMTPELGNRILTHLA